METANLTCRFDQVVYFNMFLGTVYREMFGSVLFSLLLSAGEFKSERIQISHITCISLLAQLCLGETGRNRMQV